MHVNVLFILRSPAQGLQLLEHTVDRFAKEALRLEALEKTYKTDWSEGFKAYCKRLGKKAFVKSRFSWWPPCQEKYTAAKQTPPLPTHHPKLPQSRLYRRSTSASQSVLP